MLRFATALLSVASSFAAQIAIEGHWSYKTTDNEIIKQIDAELERSALAVSKGALTNALVHEEGGFMVMQVYDDQNAFFQGFEQTFAQNQDWVERANEYVAFSRGIMYSTEEIPADAKARAVEIFGSEVTTESFESQYQFGPPVFGWVNKPLKRDSDKVFFTQVFSVQPGMGSEVKAHVKAMIDYMVGRGHTEVLMETFQAKNLGNNAFQLSILFQNSEAQTAVWEAEGKGQWNEFWSRFMEMVTAYPAVVIGTQDALDLLSDEFKNDYAPETNIYIEGAPNLKTLVKKAGLYGWDEALLFDSATVGLSQGALSMGSAALSYFQYGKGGYSTILDATMITEVAAGASMASLSALAANDEKFKAIYKKAQLPAAAVELATTAGYGYMMYDDSSLWKDYVAGLSVHPANAAVYIANYLGSNELK